MGETSKANRSETGEINYWATSWENSLDADSFKNLHDGWVPN